MLSKKFKFAVAVVGVTGLLASAANAVIFSRNAATEFIVPITLTPNADPDFGMLATGGPSRSWILATAASALNPTTDSVGGTVQDGDYTIGGDGSTTIDIDVNPGTGANDLTLTLPVCDYNAGGEVACTDASLDTAAAPGGGRTLLVGFTLQEGGTGATAGVTPLPFDIVINYN